MRASVWLCSLVLTTGCLRDDILHADGGGSTGGDSGHDDADGGTANSASEGTLGEDDADGTSGSLPTEFPGQGPYGSGSRLRPVVERSSDGVDRFRYWFDTELGMDCEFARDSVGNTRCLPLALPTVSVGYAQEDCTEPVASALACASVPSYVRGIVPGAGDCVEGARYQSFRRLELIGPGLVLPFVPAIGYCASGSNATNRNALEAVDDATFTAGTVIEEVVGELLIRGVVGDDGSFERSTVVDPRSGLPCTLIRFGNAAVIGQRISCSSVATSYASTYADSACSERVYAFPDDETCDMIPFTIGAGSERFAAGEPYDGVVYQDIAGQCTAVDSPQFTTVRYRRPGAALGPQPTYELPQQMLPDVGRLQRLGLVRDDEQELVLANGTEWVDSVVSSPCVLATTAGEDTVCASEPIINAARERLWADTECSGPELHEIFLDSDSPVRITRAEDNGCGPVITGIRNVYDDYTGPAYVGEPGDCTPVELDPIRRYVQLGNVVNVSDLPTLEIVTAE